MDAHTALTTLKERLAEVWDLGRAAGVLGWDQRVTMPPQGAEARAEALATLGRIAHDRFVDDEIGRLLDAAASLEEELGFDSDEASLVRVTRRDWEKARRVPSELRAEMTRQAARGHGIWVEARRTSDFAAFLPALRRNVELKLRYIDCFEGFDSPYDPLLDDYEPGMRASEVKEVFDRLRPVLTELVAAAPEVDASFLQGGDFPVAEQRAFAEEVLPTLGFEDGAVRLDPTVHPFCTSFSNRDVRLTTRYRHDDLESVWSTLHEAGHGLYAHGNDSALMRTPLAGAPSLGLNESQSRTWENLVGRQRPFWTHWYPRLQERFPSLATVDLDRFLRAINRAEPGLIRVDADETTYSLHIILRFELEQEIVTGAIRLEDLPEAWNARMKEFLGIDVPDDAHGVLQDVHWSGGGFGYFPTYALGNVISLQIWQRVRQELPDVDDAIATGDVSPLGDWLRDRLYRHGRKYTPQEMLERVVGSPEIDPEPYLAYLREKVEGLQELATV
jgi:carboxypeptidase Taq